MATLDSLKTQQDAARQKLLAAQKQLRALQRRERVLEAQAAKRRRERIGQLVEELGLPLTAADLLAALERCAVGLPADRQNGSPSAPNGDVSGISSRATAEKKA